MTNKHNYEAIVKEALTNPGKLSACFRMFHNYSIGNQWLAAMQLSQIEPINTFKGWQRLGRFVKKGEKAISLLMPITIKEKETGGMFFISRRNWFGLSQTSGADFVPETLPNFDLDRALAALKISKEPFKMVDGNCQGYARPNASTIAINPIATNPAKTALHEIAHCLLHSDAVQMADNASLARDVKEVEAELTAYLVLSLLGVTDNMDESRGYIQNWNAGEQVRYGRVFSTADRILKAGRPETQKEEA